MACSLQRRHDDNTTTHGLKEMIKSAKGGEQLGEGGTSGDYMSQTPRW